LRRQSLIVGSLALTGPRSSSRVETVLIVSHVRGLKLGEGFLRRRFQPLRDALMRMRTTPVLHRVVGKGRREQQVNAVGLLTVMTLSLAETWPPSFRTQLALRIQPFVSDPTDSSLLPAAELFALCMSVSWTTPSKRPACPR